MIKYELYRLGWHDFQQLCLTIVREIFGQTVSSYLDSNDAGIDGAFSGTWNQKDKEDLEGKFIIQCKFTNKSDVNLNISDLKDEYSKIEKLVLEGRCDCYILMTNYGVSGRFEIGFGKKLQSLGVKSWKIFGYNWISAQITESNRLRALVPRVYGLGDLSQILDSRAYSQAKQLLASMRDDLSKIVITSSYDQSIDAMSEHGFVLIIGEPAAGKTTIASLLAMAALDQWQLFTLKLDNPQSIIDHWNADDPNQFFWIDDAFGVTQYESNLVKQWNHILPQIKAMLNQGIKIVMTSRDYIYSRARNDLKEGAFPLFNESKVVIDLQKLSLEEKEKILYNHLKLGRQPSLFLNKIKPYLTAIAKSKHFIPETARRLAEPIFTNNLHLSENSLLHFVEKQESFLEDVIRGLDNDSKAALGLIYMNNGKLNSPIEVSEAERNTIQLLGSDIGNCVKALESMNESIVRYIFSNDVAEWRFKHPTIGDAYAKIITKSPDLLEIFLIGTDIGRLMEQITCGNVRLEKTIVIPKTKFELIADKMISYKESDAFKTGYLSVWDAERSILSFLSNRCSKDFLEMYTSKNPQLFDKLLKPSMYFRYSREVDLVVKLKKYNLFPENFRIQFIEYISHFTISGDDLSVFDDEDLQTIFSEEEVEDLRKKLKIDLLPKLKELRKKEENKFREDDIYTPEEHMEEFVSRMNILLEQYNDSSIKESIEKEINMAKEWISETFYEDNTKSERKLNVSNDEALINSTRSIFDDIDS